MDLPLSQIQVRRTEPSMRDQTVGTVTRTVDSLHTNLHIRCATQKRKPVRRRGIQENTRNPRDSSRLSNCMDTETFSGTSQVSARTALDRDRRECSEDSFIGMDRPENAEVSWSTSDISVQILGPRHS